jgi:hypothetical protein
VLVVAVHWVGVVIERRALHHQLGTEGKEPGSAGADGRLGR